MERRHEDAPSQRETKKSFVHSQSSEELVQALIILLHIQRWVGTSLLRAFGHKAKYLTSG